MITSQRKASLKWVNLRLFGNAKASDPLRFYSWPILGVMYRRRVELCLAECKPAERILEVGFGSGLTFLNLHDNYQEIHGLDYEADIEEVTSVFRRLGVTTDLKNGSILNLPYQDNMFDTVLLISILEHLHPTELASACSEIRRVLKPGGQMIYGVPIERPFMVYMFRLLGYDIRKHHFSTHEDVFAAASHCFTPVRRLDMKSVPPWFGAVYQVGHLIKRA